MRTYFCDLCSEHGIKDIHAHRTDKHPNEDVMRFDEDAKNDR